MKLLLLTGACAITAAFVVMSVILILASSPQSFESFVLTHLHTYKFAVPAVIVLWVAYYSEE